MWNYTKERRLDKIVVPGEHKLAGPAKEGLDEQRLIYQQATFPLEITNLYKHA